MFTTEHLELVQASVLCWLATVCEDGSPSVSPKEIFHADASHVLIANIASPGSKRNVRHQPRVCVAFLDVFVQKGLQAYGRAEVVTKGDEEFGRLSEPLYELAGESFPFSSLFRIEVDEVKPVVAPRYRLFPDTTENEQIASAMATYGVRPSQ